MYQAATMLEDSQNQSKHLRLLSKPVSGIMLIYFSQAFLAMLFRLVGTADTAGVCEKKNVMRPYSALNVILSFWQSKT